MRLLLVEDDPMIGEGAEKGLRQDGFAVDWVRDGQAAELALANGVYELVLLDLGLPRKGGLDVLSGLRARGNAVPVLILTARDAVPDRVKGLDCGADDYLVKPFDLDELAARVRALLRRRSGRAEPLITHGELMLNPATREASLAGKPVLLSAREFALLEALLNHPGAILSRAQLEERVYGWGEEVESNTVEVYVHSLRKKLGTRFIRNVRGVGYTIPRLE
jgi:two-component system, OmpR family, response regulator QseB